MVMEVMVSVRSVRVLDKKSCTCLVIHTFIPDHPIQHAWMDQWWLSEVNRAHRVNNNHLLPNRMWP